MKKKRAAVAALASCIALSATFAGCSLVSTNNRRDMEQVIATVDISQSENFPEALVPYKGAISSTSIVKRELVSYFLNVGYSYVQNGTSYADTFNLLVDALVDNAVLTQYCTLELLATSEQTDALNTFNGFKSDVEKYEYLLGGEDSDDVKLAKYSLFSSLNSAIDNYEKTLIEEEDEYEGTETRTTPTNLNTEQDDYYPHTKDGGLDYNVYTGYPGYLLSESGAYSEDAIEGTTRATRVKAYNSFINNLRQNYLVDGKTEDLTDIWTLEYIQDEYLNQLESRVINKYYDVYEKEQEDKLKNEEGDYSYIQSVYDGLYKSQADNYKSASAFETAMGSMSSSSFILYSPDSTDSDKFDGTNSGTFGFVYNILLPFNAKDSAALTALKSVLGANDDNDSYYIERNKLLKGITTTDQRSAWFNGSTQYAFKAEGSDYTADYFGKTDGRQYLFFEDNLTDSEEGGRFKKLQAYDGRYSYNGSVYENKDGSYTLLPEKLTIDGMLKEFSAYINYVLTGDKVSFDNGYNPENGNTAYYETKKFADTTDEDEIDYSKFVYASGKVNFDFKRSDLLNPTTDQYKAMSAVNELQFAYTTDTGVLSNYVGYSVSAYDTSYIKEFEYAAKKAISEGAGSFVVCAGDYGWHLIYVTYAFDTQGGKVYGEDVDWSRISEEGTFENLFFEWIKSKDLSDVSTTRRSKIISDFNKDSTVTRYRDRYQDLLDLGD